jgi:hypothetical protein
MLFPYISINNPAKYLEVICFFCKAKSNVLQ